MNELEQRFARVEGLLGELCAQHPEAEPIARELLGTVLELHRHGLARLLALAPSSEHNELTNDPSLAALLSLHGLHPVPAEDRARAAAAEVSRKFPGKIAQFEIAKREGSCQLTLVPSPEVCASTKAILKQACENALLEAAPDLDGLEVVFSEPRPALVQLRLGASR